MNYMYEKVFESRRLETEVKNTIQLHPTEMITETSSLEVSTTSDNNVLE